jgi:MFS family permease
VCGDKDDFWFMVGGMLVVNLMPLAYLFIETPLQLYIVQFILGVAAAFTFPSFMALFSRYIEKEQEGTVWSIYYTRVDLTSAGSAAIGGIIATTAGFHEVIYAVTIIGLISTTLYIPIYPVLKKTPCRD